jgi:hypothetical protein
MADAGALDEILHANAIVATAFEHQLHERAEQRLARALDAAVFRYHGHVAAPAARESGRIAPGVRQRDRHAC